MLQKHQYELLKAKQILDICYYWDKDKEQEKDVVQQMEKDALNVIKKSNKINVKMDEIENMMKTAKD